MCEMFAPSRKKNRKKAATAEKLGPPEIAGITCNTRLSLHHSSMAATRTPLRSLLRAPRLLSSRRVWACTPCGYGWATPRRGVATTQRSNKPYYVTTPIFYVNAGELRSLYIQLHFLMLYALSSSPCRSLVYNGHRGYYETVAGLAWE